MKILSEAKLKIRLGIYSSCAWLFLILAVTATIALMVSIAFAGFASTVHQRFLASLMSPETAFLLIVAIMLVSIALYLVFEWFAYFYKPISATDYESIERMAQTLPAVRKFAMAIRQQREFVVNFEKALMFSQYSKTVRAQEEELLSANRYINGEELHPGVEHV